MYFGINSYELENPRIRTLLLIVTISTREQGIDVAQSECSLTNTIIVGMEKIIAFGSVNSLVLPRCSISEQRVLAHPNNQ